MSFAASEIRSSFPPDIQSLGPQPDRLQPSEGPLELIAVGDLAECPRGRGLKGVLPETSNLLGLKAAFLPREDSSVETARLAEAYTDAAFLALGDLVYRSGTNAEFDQCYDPVWGKLRYRTFPAPGNHEYRTHRADGYFDYWKGQAGQDRTGYYALHRGAWLILSLNSEVPADPASDQGRWLAKTLEEASERCILAFYHKPAHSIKSRGGSEAAIALFRALQQAGATLVLNGHNHFYERTAPLDAEGRRDNHAGTIEFTVGTGGKTSHSIPPRDTTDAAIFETRGLLRLMLGESAFTWSFLSATDGRPLDEGRASCNPARQLTLVKNS
ncbi:metallophosphoesterase family protein [Roseivivax halotolerans]|nr:metallophosphoesterase [Roseivivax halotolerans]